MKEQIEQLVRSGKCMKEIAVILGFPYSKFPFILEELWPETHGRWTKLCELLGVDPWATTKRNTCAGAAGSAVFSMLARDFPAQSSTIRTRSGVFKLPEIHIKIGVDFLFRRQHVTLG